MYHNEDAEKAIIGAILSDNNIIENIIPWIQNKDVIYDVQYRMIWNAILKLHESNTPIDIITLTAKCKDIYGDRIDIMKIISASEYISPLNAESHAKIVWGENVKRHVSENSDRLKEALAHNSDDVENIVFNQMEYLQELLSMQPSKSNELHNIIEVSFKEILLGNSVIRTGLPYMDRFASGLTKGEVTAIGGRPGHGKTTLALNIMKSLVENQVNVMYISREMPNTEVLKKLICQESDNIKYTSLRSMKKASPDMEIKLITTKNIVLEKYSKYLRLYDDIFNLSGAVREIERWKPDVFIDDYIQLAMLDKSQDRRFDIEDIMRTYKRVAKKNHISGIILSQLNRDIDNRIEQSPVMGDYAEGSAVEHNSETCLFILYPYVFDSNNKSKYYSEIVAKKVRYGTVGTYPIGYNPDKCMYYNNEEQAIESVKEGRNSE